MQNSASCIFCILVIYMHSPLCWWYWSFYDYDIVHHQSYQSFVLWYRSFNDIEEQRYHSFDLLYRSFYDIVLAQYRSFWLTILKFLQYRVLQYRRSRLRYPLTLAILVYDIVVFCDLRYCRLVVPISVYNLKDIVIIIIIIMLVYWKSSIKQVVCFGAWGYRH